MIHLCLSTHYWAVRHQGQEQDLQTWWKQVGGMSAAVAIWCMTYPIGDERFVPSRTSKKILKAFHILTQFRNKVCLSLHPLWMAFDIKSPFGNYKPLNRPENYRDICHIHPSILSHVFPISNPPLSLSALRRPWFKVALFACQVVTHTLPQAFDELL